MNKKKIPFGYYSRRHYVICTAIIAVIIAVLFFLTFKFVLDDFMNIIWFLPLVGIVTFILMFLTIILTNPYLKAVKKFYKDLNYKELNESLNKLYEENLHDEIRSEIMSIQSNFLIIIDKRHALDMFKEIKVPNNKNVLNTYEAVEIIMAINTDKEKANELLTKFIQKNGRKVRGLTNKLVENLELLYTIFHSDEYISDIENKFKETNRFTKINKYSALMTYYFTRNDINKAKDYAQMILDEKTLFKQINDEAQEILKL